MPDLKLPDTKPSPDSWLKLGDSLMEDGQEPTKRKHKPKFLIPLQDDFKDALRLEAQKEHRTLTNWILKVLVDKIKWKGKI